MSDFPDLKGELRPRLKLKKHVEEPVSDDTIEANSRQLGEKWGAATSLPTADASPSPPPFARVVSIRGYIPHYLDDELTMQAASRRVTKTFLIMEALGKAGYRVEPADLIQDRRRNKT